MAPQNCRTTSAFHEVAISEPCTPAEHLRSALDVVDSLSDPFLTLEEAVLNQ